jgi:hypothetical protein
VQRLRSGAIVDPEAERQRGRRVGQRHLTAVSTPQPLARPMSKRPQCGVPDGR